jgi:hypothetical protein
MKREGFAMSSVEPASEITRRKPLWKRVLLISVCVLGGLAVLGIIIGVGIDLYYSFPRKTRSWPDKDVESNGLKASLKTRWRDDTLHYRLEISALSPDLSDSFDKAWTLPTESMHLALHLYDDSGFELCSNEIEASDIKKNVNKEGKIGRLSANATWPSCSLERYNDSRKWGLSWKSLPNVNVSAAITNVASGEQAPPVTKSRKNEESEKLEGGTTLTGVDTLHGRLDTESGQTFLVYRSGERNTIIWWSAKQKLRFRCKTASDCLVVNTSREETVHARLTE